MARRRLVEFVMPNVLPVLGAPCWFELTSRDPSAAQAYYQQLFGWSGDAHDLSDMGAYTFLGHASGAVGALCGMPPGSEQRPSAWGVYFLVANVDASVEQARALGGDVLYGPFDVPGMGRGAALADPSGAAFSLWQPAAVDGAGLAMFEPDTFGWVELASKDADGAAAFYSALLGWTCTTSPVPLPGAGNYIEYAVGATRYGGILPMTKEWGDMPSHWSMYVIVSDLDDCLQRAGALGGTICVAPFDVPGVGRIARIDDPTGAGLYVIQMAARG